MTDTNKILEKTLEHYVPSLSKSELIVHYYTIHHPEQVIYSTVSQLSHLMGVGEATVMRYCKKIGFNSFVQFKMELFKLLGEAETSACMPYIDQIADNMTKSILATKNIIDETQIELAKDLILGSKRLLITGQGASNITAQDAFSKFIRLGVDASLVLDNHLLYMYSSIIDKNTVVLCYSYSGETQEVIKVAKLAKENDCKIIGITNYESSEIAKLSDICLYTSGYEKNIHGGFFSSKVSQLFLTDVLVTRCATEDLAKTKKYNELVTKSIMQEEE